MPHLQKMVLRKDVEEASIRDGTARPVDLIHLSSQTFGDRSLQNEIISIFLSQANAYLDGIASRDEAYAARAAHSLKGAARAIGAFRLAEIAEHCEVSKTRDIGALGAEAGKVCDYLRSLA
ncbi:MAG: Hpt domain-containing protein [Nitratireductor sp.]|nr:Hpt domain-containing protein [Nitratireductor sp.]MCC0019804.1 Hpt domain-containing protein [Nitratireductor sp.]